MNFGKFLRTSFLQNTSEWLLLVFLLLNENQKCQIALIIRDIGIIKPTTQSINISIPKVIQQETMIV